MPERRVLRLGHPQLQRAAAPVADFDTPALHALVADLWDTMRARGGVGIAAPQIGVGLRVAVFGMERHPRYPELPPVPHTVLVNPALARRDEALEDGWEGCLSLPGFRGLVARSQRVRYTGFDAHGEPVAREAEGFHARIVQHELDHLDGILYPQRLHDPAAFGYEEELSLAGRLSPGC